MKRIRAVLRTALVWGAAWAGVVLASITPVIIRQPYSQHPITWPIAFLIGLKWAIRGALASAMFSVFVGLRYRGRQLSDLQWTRFAFGGAIAAGSVVYAVFAVAGSRHMLLDIAKSAGVWALIGGTVAAGSLKLAQVADRRDRLRA